jgi:GAF domain-containing protein
MSAAVRVQDRPTDKAARYAEVLEEIAAVLAGEPNLTARMATVSSILADAFEPFFWTGFYVVDPDKPRELVVGPYQGTMGCLRIPFGRGVCGAAAETGEIKSWRTCTPSPATSPATCAATAKSSCRSETPPAG